MGWKKIMNKRSTADAVVREEAEQYLLRILPELNLRLLMEADAPAQSILWVESATVTAYRSAPAAVGDEGIAEAKTWPERIAKCLMGMPGKARSLKK